MSASARLLQIYLATPGRSLRDEPKEQCSFCLRDRAEVDYILAGPRAGICFRCIARCVAALKEHRVAGWRRWWDPRPARVVSDDDAAGSPYRGAAECSFCGLTNPKDTLFA